ncbi:MAG TPA: single-stranded-DNA-specific exonuclease RecJ [Ktedonobacterales bacterium]
MSGAGGEFVVGGEAVSLGEVLARLARVARIADERPRTELMSIPGVTPLQAQLLANRGAGSPRAAREFLEAGWRASGPLPDQDAAVSRLIQAIETGVAITVYGDHDCDGITSCAILTLALRDLGANVTAYIPLRDDDGRGLNDEAVRQLSARGARLIVTTDCGTSNVAEVALAHELGMDVIITDHHPVHGDAPVDCAIVNPWRASERSTRDDLSGAGVAFRLAEALLQSIAPDRAGVILEGLLDLAATGIIGDIVPLTRESWGLARAGLARLRTAPQPGLRALLERAGVAWRQITERDITYVIAPRLNAAARLGEPSTALELLLATDAARVIQLAERLEELNQERQRITEEIMRDAQAMVESSLAQGDAREPGALVSAIKDGWPLGMLGLVASRLTERYGRPSVVISREGAEARGSARAPEGYDLGQALAARAPIFRRFGGHARAAGFTLPSSEVGALLSDLERRLAAQRDALAQARAADGDPLAVDLRLTLNRLAPRIYHEQQALAPFGPAFPAPTYIAMNVRILGCWRSGSEGRNLRLRARDSGADRVFFWARQGDLCDVMRPLLTTLPALDLIFTLDAFIRPTGDLDLLPRVLGLRVVG